MSNAYEVDVVTIGESMVLFQSMQDGPLQYSALFTKSMAGAESNVSIGLSRLGQRVRWISRLGQDPFGDHILATLAGEGVDTSLVVRDSLAPTAIYFKEFMGCGDPTVYYYRRQSAASHLSPDEVKPAWFSGARHLHVTGITPALGPATADAVRHAMHLAREMGLTISFDPNLRRKLWSESVARDTLLSLIALCDVFLPGEEEAEFLLGSGSIEAHAQTFLDMGPKVVVVKLGSQGSAGFAHGHAVREAAYPIARVVDTVGAGDAFAAGFLSALLESADGLAAMAGHSSTTEIWSHLLPDALRRANLMGALATQWKGDWEGLPRRADVMRLLAGQGAVTR